MADKFLIKKPIISEKAVQLGQKGTYVFMVADHATTPEVRKALQAIYNVTIVKANVINAKPKTKRFGRSVGIKPGYKKVIVTLKEGQKLDILPQ